MPNRPSNLYITAAFVAGILLTLGFKDFYPDLERRFRRRSYLRWTSDSPRARPDSTDDHDGVCLVDDTLDEIHPAGRGPRNEIADGIEGCIGNTPLFRIKSLSEATGCDILAKAEVGRARVSAWLEL